MSIDLIELTFRLARQDQYSAEEAQASTGKSWPLRQKSLSQGTITNALMPNAENSCWTLTGIAREWKQWHRALKIGRGLSFVTFWQHA